MSQSQVNFDYTTRSKIQGLLSDYTNTLKEASDSIEQFQTRSFVLISLVGLILSIGAGFISYGWVRFQSTGNAFGWIAGIFGFLVATLFTRLYYSSRRKSRLIARQSEIIGLKLERIMQLASQIAEHGELTAAEKLEIELRLVEAEGALRFARFTGHSEERNTSDLGSGAGKSV